MPQDINEHFHDEENKTEKVDSAKESLEKALDVFVQDTDVPSEADEEAHHKWEENERKKAVPKLPESLGGEDTPDKDGNIYLEYSFTVNPEKYVSPNYQPIANAAAAGNTQAKPQNAGTKESDGNEPSQSEESKSAEEADKALAEAESIGKPIEKTAQDEMPEKAVLDYATYIDGSSFLCFDDESSIDYSKITMDAGVKTPAMRPNCKTTFAQCRAKNPLFCRYHGPKILEKDIKTNIAHALGPGIIVSVTKDKGQKNPMTFRLTIGCPPSKKKDVEGFIHHFMTDNPGISSPEEFKNLGGGKQTMEFDMDLLEADKPPKKDTKGDAAKYAVEKAKAAGKVMPVVGDTPAKIEKLAAAGGVPEGEEQPEESPKKDKPKPKSKKKQDEQQEAKPVETPQDGEGGETTSPQGTGNAEGADGDEAADQKEYEAMMAASKKNGYTNIPDFKKSADEIASNGELYPTAKEKKEALSNLLNSANWPYVNHITTKPQTTPPDDADLGEYETEIGNYSNTLKSIEEKNKFLVESDQHVSALYYGATMALDGLKYEANNVALAEKSKVDLGKKYDLANPAMQYTVKTFDATIGAHKEKYGEAKANFDQAMKDLNEAVETANNDSVDTMKGIYQGSITDVVKTTAALVFPQGKPVGVGSAAEMIDHVYDILIDQGKSLMSEDKSFSLDSLKEKHGLTAKYKAVAAANNDLDAAIASYKEKADEATTIDSVELLKPLVEDVQNAAKTMKDAFAAFKIACDRASKDIGDTKEANKQKQLLAEKKAAIAKKLAEMPLEEKLKKGIEILKKKLANSPDDEELKAKLKKYEAHLAKMVKA